MKCNKYQMFLALPLNRHINSTNSDWYYATALNVNIFFSMRKNVICEWTTGFIRAFK